MKYLSLFSGVGGFELGIERAFNNQEPPQRGVEGNEARPDNKSDSRRRASAICVGYSEIDPYAIRTYESHFKHPSLGDCTAIKPARLPDFDLLVGGFPCQAFSVAGKRHGFNDTRGTLFFDIARILKDKRPRHFLLENVKGLLSHNGGKTIQTIARVLSDLGYRIEWQVLNAKDFGVPQNRERIFIVGHLRGECGRQVFPIGGHDSQTLENLIAIDRGKLVKRKVTTAIDANYYKGMDNHQQRTGVMVAMQWRRSEKGRLVRRENQRKGRDYTPFSNDHRELVPNPTKPVGALTSQAIAKDSLLGDGARIRRLTPVECERLMSLPDNWTAGVSDTQRYRQCGNGVVVNCVQAVIEGMYKCLI